MDQLRALPKDRDIFGQDLHVVTVTENLESLFLPLTD
jgi:hypothetical protein